MQEIISCFAGNSTTDERSLLDRPDLRIQNLSCNLERDEQWSMGSQMLNNVEILRARVDAQEVEIAGRLALYLP